MKERFVFNEKTKKISMQVQIGTPGIANTQVYKRGNGDQTVKIAESDIESANIPLLYIKDPSTIEGKSVAVQTIINFSNFDNDQLPQLLKSISSLYTVWDDVNNKKTFQHDGDDLIVSNDGRTVFIIKLFVFQKAVEKT